MYSAMIDIWNWIKEYYGNAWFLASIVVAGVYILVVSKQERKRLIYPLILIVLCLLNPILYIKLFSRIYLWRFFWLIPSTILIAYMITDIVRRIDKVWIKAAMVIITAVLIILMGANVFTHEVFTLIKNPQKVSQETKAVCDIMLSVDDKPSCMVPHPLITEVRQYNGDIHMMYGRNAMGYINLLDNACDRAFQELHSEVPNYDYVFDMANVHRYDFVVTLAAKPVDASTLEMYGYVLQGTTESYNVYYKPDIDNRKMSGVVVTAYSQLSDDWVFFTIENAENELILIGNVPCEYTEKVRAILRNHNNKAVSWIIPEPLLIEDGGKNSADDNDGKNAALSSVRTAADEIMENPQGAQIDEIERVIEGTTKNCFGVDVAFGRNEAGEPGIYVGKDNWWGSFVHAKWESLAWMVHIWE